MLRYKGPSFYIIYTLKWFTAKCIIISNKFATILLFIKLESTTKSYNFKSGQNYLHLHVLDLSGQLLFNLFQVYASRIESYGEQMLHDKVINGLALANRSD